MHKFVKILFIIFMFCIIPTMLLAREYNLYYGNFHSHSKYSPVDLWTIIPPVIESLVGSPREAFAYARDSAGIDILAITDHTHPTTPLIGGPYYLPQYWDSTLIAADDATVHDTFLALAGFEWSSINLGHINVFNTEDFRFTYPTDNLDSIYNWLSLRPMGIGQFNHPTIANFDSFRYRPNFDPSMYLYEMQNNAEASRYYFALDKGWRVGMSANQDNHVFQIHGGIKWGAGNQLTGVWADSLTKSSIFSALRQMRTFGTLDRNFSLKFTANDSWMGSTIDNGNIQFRITASDPDTYDLISRIDIITNNGTIFDSMVNIDSNQAFWQKDTFISDNQTRYFFARVIESDTNYILSSAIWVRGNSSVQEPQITSAPSNYFILDNNFPNPFSSQTLINYYLPLDCYMNFRIYNSAGIFVRELKASYAKQGKYRIAWDGCNNKGQKLDKGIYFYRLEAGDYSAMKKMVLLK